MGKDDVVWIALVGIALLYFTGQNQNGAGNSGGGGGNSGGSSGLLPPPNNTTPPPTDTPPTTIFIPESPGKKSSSQPISAAPSIIFTPTTKDAADRFIVDTGSGGGGVFDRAAGQSITTQTATVRKIFGL